jgi:hypothetical protein
VERFISLLLGVEINNFLSEKRFVRVIFLVPSSPSPPVQQLTSRRLHQLQFTATGRLHVGIGDAGKTNDAVTKFG